MDEKDDKARSRDKDLPELAPEDLKKLPEGKKTPDQRAVEEAQFSNFLNRIVDRLDPGKRQSD